MLDIGSSNQPTAGRKQLSPWDKMLASLENIFKEEKKCHTGREQQGKQLEKQPCRHQGESRRKLSRHLSRASPAAPGEPTLEQVYPEGLQPMEGPMMKQGTV